MADCTIAAREQVLTGEWMDGIYCWLTAGGDPTLTIVVPVFVYGVVLLSMFITGQSPLMPVVVSIILAGVVFAAFPASGLTLIALAALFVLTIGGMLLTRRFGQ